MMCSLYIWCVYCSLGDEEVPTKRSRKCRVKAGHDREYDSDQDVYDLKASKTKLRNSRLKELFVADDGDEDFYQCRMRYML